MTTDSRRMTRAEVEAALEDLHEHEGTALDAVIDLHAAYGQPGGYGWAECEGCDSGEYAEGPASWPCSTVEAILGYSIYLVANHDPVPERKPTGDVWELMHLQQSMQEAMHDDMRRNIRGAINSLAARLGVDKLPDEPVVPTKIGYPVHMRGEVWGLDMADGIPVVYSDQQPPGTATLIPSVPPELVDVYAVAEKYLPTRNTVLRFE